MPRRGLVVAREEEVVVALPRNKHLRFPTPTKPPALPSEILLFLFAKKSTAAQLTYNRTMGEWAATDRAALRDPFEWFVKFFLWLSGLLGTEGLSCTVQEQRRAALHL